MALNADKAKFLRDFFPADEHEFLYGMCYIREWAICNRIEEVDPSWDFSIVSIERRDQQITVLGRMTIAGVTRENTGMATIGYTKDKTKDDAGKEIETLRTDIAGHPIESNEAEKSATTDALKRCARLFGIGRYLLRLGDGVKNEQQLASWLEKETGGDKPLSFKTVTYIEVAENTDGKRYLKTEHGITSFTREPFKQAGYDTDKWTDPGIRHMINARVYFTQNRQGYKTVERVTNLDAPEEKSAS